MGSVETATCTQISKVTEVMSDKQKQGENIQIYAERIILAEEAYNNQGVNAIESQLIDTFVDGLNNE